MDNMSRVNFLGKIRRGSRVLENPIEVKAKVVRFFVNLYKGDIFDRPKLEGVSFPSLPNYLWRFKLGWRGSLRRRRLLRL